jgi:hypothetical protein
MIRTIAWWALIAFGAWYLFTNPDGAAALVGQMLGALRYGAGSLSRFASHL